MLDSDSMGETFIRGHRPPSGAPISPGTYALRFQAAPPAGMSHPYMPSPMAPAMPLWHAGHLAPPIARPAMGYAVPVGARMALPPAAVAPRRESWLARWRRRNAGKYWWKILLLGLLLYPAATGILAMFPTPTIVPLVILLASAIVPVTFVVYCWERGAFAEMPATILGLAFVSGAVLGPLVAISLESLLVPPIPIVGPFAVALIEESAKILAVIWFLRNRRLRGERDGLALGAAAGMGFATLETAGYGFTFFLGGFAESLAHGPSLASAFGAGLLSMTLVLVLRMLLAVFGHGTWTAITCAAIWRDRGASALRITWGVALAFGISVTLHAMWDMIIFTGSKSPSPAEILLLLVALLCMPLAAFAGLWILRFFLREAADRATLGALAPAPTPLLEALALYLIHPRRRPLHTALAYAQFRGWLAPGATATPGAAPVAGAPSVVPVVSAGWAIPPAPRFAAQPLPGQWSAPAPLIPGPQQAQRASAPRVTRPLS